MIPTSITQADANWLSETLKNEVKEVSYEQIGQGVGIMGDIFRVSLTGDDVPASVVVKLPSSFEENRAQGVALGMFDAEVRFYKELAPEATVGLPKVFHAEIEPGTANFVVVMEDLSHLDAVNQTEGMTIDQASAAVRVLAATHAVWWDRVQADEFSWIPTMIGPRIEMVDQMMTQIVDGFLEGFAQYLPDQGPEIYKLFAGNYINVNKTLAARSPWTLAHQDYRVENLLFGPAGSGEVVVLDWQGIGLGPGAYDLAYILGGSMDTDLRRQNESALLDAYYEKLKESGIGNYTRDQLSEDYSLAHLMGGMATSMVTGATMDLSNERGLQLIATMACRHAEAALDHNGLEVLRTF